MYCGSLFVCQPSGTIRDTPRHFVAGVVVAAVVWIKARIGAGESNLPPWLAQAARQSGALRRGIKPFGWPDRLNRIEHRVETSDH